MQTKKGVLMTQNIIHERQKIDRIGVTIYCSIIIIALALTSFNFFVSDFEISVGVILLAVFLFMIPEFPLINVSVVCAAGIVVVRSIASDNPASYVAHHISRCLPEALSYLIYGILLYLSYRFFKEKLNSFAYMVVILAICDYIPNCCELMIRLHGGAFTEECQIGIMVVAVVRALAAWFAIFLLKKYLAFVHRYENDSIRYRLLDISDSLEMEADLLAEAEQKAAELSAKLQDTADCELSELADSLMLDLEKYSEGHRAIRSDIAEVLEEEGDIC
ncbi:MAG: hypothetical protein Q4B78_03880 [Bacillota bacterium]|nr:hypothetical protein [Bacillota bacterium]